MDTKVLETMWSKLNLDQTNEFVFLRISSECIPELNIGIDSSRKRSLLLELPEINSIQFNSVIKENLSIELFKDTNYIVLKLLDSTYDDIFNEFIISIYNLIKKIQDINESVSKLLTQFHKWSNFFDDRKNDKLDLNAIKGLFGELVVLKYLIETSSGHNIDDVLNSWKGPFNLTHDFILDNTNLEVKTKEESKLDIRISSEFQLQPEPEKQLELMIVSIFTNDYNGISIKQMVWIIKDLIKERLGDVSILFTGLKAMGLYLTNIPEYDNYRFRPTKISSYDCNAIGFPRIIKTTLQIGISDISYNLRVPMISQFKILEIIL